MILEHGAQRVLHIGKYFAPQLGGMERFLEDLIKAQHAAGLSAFALVHEAPNTFTSTQLPDPAWLRRVPVTVNFGFAPVALRFVAALNRAIADWQPDYLHFHVPNLAAVMALGSVSARRLPWVVHWHSDVVASEHALALRVFSPFYRPFERALLERAALIIATSSSYLRSSESLSPFAEKCTVVPLGIDRNRLAETNELCSEIDKLERGSQGGIPSGREDGFETDHAAPIRLLAMGRLTYYKGFDTLIRAVAQVPNAQLEIIGAGQDEEKLRALIRQLALDDRVRLLGALSDQASGERFRVAEVFCLPSRERTEAFGLVLLEAMHFGLPLLVSAIPGSGVLDIVRSGFNGELALVDEPAAWRDAIVRLSKSPSTRRQMGANGRDKALPAYTIARVARHLQHVVTNTLAPDAALPEVHTRPLIVIPARDEAATIATVVREIIAAGYADVLVVDDASTDATGAIALEAGARSIRAPLAQGAWGAMQTGLRYAVRHNFSSVITMDADGQHLAHQIPALIAMAIDSDVVVGACPERGSRARHAAWSLFRAITGFKLSDLTSGFRLYNLAACRVLASADATLLDYQDLGVLLLLQQHELRISEVEVQMLPRSSGRSRIFYSWWAVLRYMAETVVLCLARRRWRVAA